MFIFNKKTNTILNTEQIISIYIPFDGSNEIYYYKSGGHYNGTLAGYKTSKRAQEVLRQIFIAMTDGLKTFEMPED